jgi:DNA-binding NarL/FixJ family response regulator
MANTAEESWWMRIDGSMKPKLSRSRFREEPARPEPIIFDLKLGASRVAVLSVPLPDAACASVLTVAEREVAALAAAGFCNAAIAHRRVTSERTVANQIAALLRKLKVGSRFELVARLALDSRSAGAP